MKKKKEKKKKVRRIKVDKNHATQRAAGFLFYFFLNVLSLPLPFYSVLRSFSILPIFYFFLIYKSEKQGRKRNNKIRTGGLVFFFRGRREEWKEKKTSREKRLRCSPSGLDNLFSLFLSLSRGCSFILSIFVRFSCSSFIRVVDFLLRFFHGCCCRRRYQQIPSLSVFGRPPRQVCVSWRDSWRLSSSSIQSRLF